MTPLRRHLVAVAGLILSAQTLALALGTAQVCWPGDHTHGGVSTPNCAMHHAIKAETPAMDHQSHAVHAESPEAPSDRGAKMTCRCTNDSVPIDLGQPAIIAHPAPSLLLMQSVMLEPGNAPSICAPLFSPPSPPPR